jgi:hypothetical protein
MSRWIRFFIAILIGIAAGLAYAWYINPVKYVDTSPDTLRIDYKSDYVLMVAEAFSNEGDLPMAIRRLALLGNRPPIDVVREAILFAQGHGYADNDVAQMEALSTALQKFNPLVGTPTP